MGEDGDRSLLITNGRVLRTTDPTDSPDVADVLVRGGRIVEVGKGLAEGLRGYDLEVLDAADKLVLPGFVNAHYHSHDVLAKGTNEETPLEIWRLLALPPQYPRRSREEVKVRALLGAYECLRSGMTTIQDMVTLYPFDPEHLDAVIEAYEEIGIRAVVGLQYSDRKGIDTVPFWADAVPAELQKGLSTAAEPDRIDQLTHLEEARLSDARHARISWALCPSAPERCSPELLSRTSDLADRYDLPIFSHIYESRAMALQARRDHPTDGGSQIRRLQRTGFLGPRLNLAHSVWLQPDETQILAESGTKVIINPLSNLKLKSGIPPIRELENAGVDLGLGCDNCSCSDAQNMFQAMKLFALLAAVSDPEPGLAQAEQALGAATTAGAAAVNLGTEIGRLEPGFRADLLLVDLTDPSWIPMNSAVRQLVYSESGRGVTTVIVDGRVVVRDGVLETMNEAELMGRVDDVMPAFRDDLATVRERVDKLRPYLLDAHTRVWATDVGGNRLFTGQ